MHNYLFAGVDIGGSHITVALVDMSSGAVIKNTWRRLPVNSQNKAQDIIAQWCKAIKESFAAHPVAPAKIGIAMPGPFDYTNGIALMQNQNKYDALYGLNIKQMLSEKLHI